ncbi:MAG: hypothetical protein U0R80_03380 [Nocardioidaceae bacterium]
MATLAVWALVIASPWFPWRRFGRLLTRTRAAVVARRRNRASARPIEQLARDARRLGVSYRSQPRGKSFVKYEAHRRAYDDVLTLTCEALGITHLLGVLEPGPELDQERRRVEGRLELAGVDLNLPL